MNQLLFYLRQDARHGQILVLSTLLILGQTLFGFDLTPLFIATIFGTALATQWVMTALINRIKGLHIPVDLRSAVITSCSLCLIFKTTVLGLAALAAFMAIASKFTLRWGNDEQNKHIFNPANIGIVAVAFLFTEAWVSPGQWGNGLWLGFLLACAALVVLSKSKSADMSLAFIGSYALLLYGRALWLGDPWTIPTLQMQSGTLLLFTFFMISDPKTIPNHRGGRILYGLSVAALAIYLQYYQFDPTGLLYALTIGSLFVPLIDKLLPAPATYVWGYQPVSDNSNRSETKELQQFSPVNP